jgi:di/tricarboxylate transporter
MRGIIIVFLLILVAFALFISGRVPPVIVAIGVSLAFPISIAMAHELGVSPMPIIVGIAIASHAALLTPIATPVNLMVMGRVDTNFRTIQNSGFFSPSGG